jgi:hypothetical protein
MQNSQNKISQNAQIVEAIGNQVEEFIHYSMDAGKKSKKEAWSMIEILDQVSIRFGREVKPYAKQYMLQLLMK